MAVTVNVPVASIKVGDRRREEYGAVDELAASIKAYGLLHPIVVDIERTLVAGGRRLAAVKLLGWPDVPVRMLDSLTDAELREIELEENLQRKDLTSFELGKSLVDLANVAAQLDKENHRGETFPTVAEPPEDSAFFDVESVSDEKYAPPRLDSKRGGSGRFTEKPGSLRRVAERIGVDKKTIQNARVHVETADAFPIMQKPDWKQSHVLQAREALERLPEPERPAAVKVADQPRTHPQDVVMLLQNVAQKPAEERREIYRLNESSDPRDRDLAVTKAAGAPPMPDPRIVLLDFALDKIRAAIRPYPHDPLTPRLKAVRDEMKAIKVEVEAVSYDVHRQTEGAAD